jgi:hypothetical protein
MISSIRYIACILFLLSVAQHIEAKNEFRGFFHRAYIAVVWVHRYGSDPGSGCDAGYAEAVFGLFCPRPPPCGAPASALHRSALERWRIPEFRQEGGPGFWFETQHELFCRLAVADTDAAACKARGLQAVSIAHAV